MQGTYSRSVNVRRWAYNVSFSFIRKKDVYRVPIVKPGTWTGHGLIIKDNYVQNKRALALVVSQFVSWLTKCFAVLQKFLQIRHFQSVPGAFICNPLFYAIHVAKLLKIL